MAKYHISPESGRPNICRAEKQNCPLKGEDGRPAPHFTDKKEAKAYAEGKLTEEHGETKTVSRENNDNSVIKVDGFADFNAEKSIPQDFDKVYSEVLNRVSEASFMRDRAYSWIQQKFNTKKYNPETRKSEYVEDGGKVLADVRKRTDLSAQDRDLVERWERSEREEVKNVILKTKLERAFRKRGGWNRAYLVPDGHLHKSMDCSTCNKGETPTKFQFMTDYSGENEQQIVQAAGYRACTTCYPTAPVGDSNSLPSKMLTDDEIKRNEERAEQKQKLEKKKVDAVSKAATAHGEPLKVKTLSSYDEVFKTERSASAWYVDGITGSQPYEQKDRDKLKESRYKVAYNLALKHDKSIAEIQEEFQKKVVAKSKRDYKEAMKYHQEMPQVYSKPSEEVPEPDKYDIPSELLNKSPREWENANNYIPED